MRHLQDALWLSITWEITRSLSGKRAYSLKLVVKCSRSVEQLETTSSLNFNSRTISKTKAATFFGMHNTDAISDTANLVYNL